MDINQQARDILDKVIYLTLATVSDDGRPWNSPVYSSRDEQNTFYWVSSPSAQHSQNIKTNGRVFAVVYDSTQREGTGFGVYLEGRAEEMTILDEIAKALPIYYRQKDKPVKDVESFLGDSPRRLYRFIPERCWINSDVKIGDFHVDGKDEVKL